MTAERNFAALRYPRSFLGLLIAGFLLVALPLLGTLLYSALHTQRLTEQGRNAVFGAAKAAAASRSLVNRIASIERLSLQLAVLPDAQLRADFARAHASFKQLAGELAQLPLDAGQLAALERTLEREQTLHDRITKPPPGLQLREVRELAGALVDDAYQVLAVSYLVADREVERLGASADEVHRRLIVMVLIATALALAAAL